MVYCHLLKEQLANDLRACSKAIVIKLYKHCQDIWPTIWRGVNASESSHLSGSMCDRNPERTMRINFILLPITMSFGIRKISKSSSTSEASRVALEDSFHIVDEAVETKGVVWIRASGSKKRILLKD